jgi:hypothetical protein
MSTGLLIAIVAGGSALIVAVALLMSRGGGGGGLLCGGCQRAMLPTWTQCLFCGWSPAAASSARLEVMSGPLAGQVVPLHGEITTIGSIPGNTVVLPDTAVSKKHAGIRLADGRFELADLGSTNGVFVNGGQTAKKQLEDGDVIRIGLSEIVFRR